MRRILLMLTGILAALGLTLGAAPASAAPASSDDVGPLVTVANAYPQQFLQGVPQALMENVNCGAISPTAFSAQLVDPTRTVTLFASRVVVGGVPVCSTPVAQLTAANPTDSGMGTPLGMFGAQGYASTL